MKHWEIIADNLSKAGWSWGCVSALDSQGRTIWIADAHHGDGKRFVVHADETLIAFVELELAFYSPAVSAPICFDVTHNCWFERANFYPDPPGDDRLRQQLASLPRGAKADEY
jgi:hypothetical protein